MVLAHDVRLVPNFLIVYQSAFLDEVPAAGFHAFVVVADRAQRAGLGHFVGHNVHQLRAVGQALGLPLQGSKRGTGEVGLVAQHAVQLQRVAHGLSWMVRPR